MDCVIPELVHPTMHPPLSPNHLNDNLKGQVKFNWKTWYDIEKIFSKATRKIIKSNSNNFWGN
jgi:hypothetical protein